MYCIYPSPSHAWVVSGERSADSRQALALWSIKFILETLIKVNGISISNILSPRVELKNFCSIPTSRALAGRCYMLHYIKLFRLVCTYIQSPGWHVNYMSPKSHLTIRLFVQQYLKHFHQKQRAKKIDNWHSRAQLWNEWPPRQSMDYGKLHYWDLGQRPLGFHLKSNYA
jgi:hypothetical protein